MKDITASKALHHITHTTKRLYLKTHKKKDYATLFAIPIISCKKENLPVREQNFFCVFS